MTILINGKKFEFEDAITLEDAMGQNGISNNGVATAVNGVVIPASSRAKTILTNGDKVVIIKAFYGG